MIDFSQIKFRASSWDNLMTEPREKAARDRGELSKTCQRELIKIYNLVVYGRRKEIVTKQMTKGILVEEDSIDIFSRAEGKYFVKNEEYLENEWFCGHPDIFFGESIRKAKECHDIKSNWELDTFMPRLIEAESDYECQLNVYFDLTGADCGSIANCLVSAPPSVLLDEKRRLLYAMDVISDESPEYKKAEKELEKNMLFEDIDYRERIIKQEFHRNDGLIQQMKEKTPRLRQWLTDFHKKHLSLYPKPILTDKI